MSAKEILAAKQKNDKYVKFCWESVNLVCEWNGCNEESDLLSFYLRHVDDHMNSLSLQAGEHPCLWHGCESAPLSAEELHCHVMYHAFHSKLKSFGRNMLIRKKLPSCKLDDTTKNFIPEITGALKCRWKYCNECFHSPESFYRHVDIHAEDYPKGNKLAKSVTCMWEDCGTTFSSQYKLKEHFRVHTQEKMVSCPICGSMFASRTKLVDHVNRQYVVPCGGKKSKIVYQCEYCSKRLATDRLLRDHMRGHVNHYKCPYCNMTCPTPSSLKNHVLYRHSNEKHFACQNCEYKAKTSHDLQRHMDLHNDISYTCPGEGCSFKTHSEGALFHHVRRFHQDHSLYTCHICEKQFTRGAYLTKHLMKCHQLKWPAGHSRFRYKKDRDGLFRLQMVRYETIELSQQIQRLEQEKKLQREYSEDYVEYSDDDPDDPDAVDARHILPDAPGTMLATPLVLYLPPEVGEKDPPVETQQFNQSGLKKIQVLTTASDGSTVLQTAEVIAEGIS